MRVWWLGQEDPLEEKWLPTPVFLPGKFQEQRNLGNYSPWGHKESDMTEHTKKTYMIKPNLLRKHYFCSLHVSAETFSKGVDAIFWWPVFWMKARSASLPLLGPALGSCSQLGRGWEGKCWAEGLAQLLLQLQILNAAVSHQCASALLNCHL